MNNFDITRIPESVLHDAVYEALGQQKIEKIREGYNFRCPLCGDSKSNPYKKRGYVYINNGQWTYFCYNECGPMSFLNFLKRYNNILYKKVVFHGFERSNKPRKRIEEKSYLSDKVYKFKDKELVDLFNPHPTAVIALTYCKERKIPEKIYSKWFVCIRDDKFLDKDSSGVIIYNELGCPVGNEYGNRLIIPYYRLGGKWSQFDARALDNSQLRYKNLKGAERELYNIDFLDVNKPFFLLEGAINSTFIKNSVAFGGTKHLKNFLEQYPILLEHKSNGVFIWDNDGAGYDEMQSTIRLGFGWFNWESIKPLNEFRMLENEFPRIIKDINDLVLYSDMVELDEEGFIKYDSLKNYIEYNTGSGEFKSVAQYGKRTELKKKRFKEVIEQQQQKKKLSEPFWWKI
jgi:hypothetical protein